MRLLLVGPPGAGKGTQARRLADEHGVPHIASGDLLRDNIRKGTPLGRKAEEYVNRGDYVPDEVMIDVLSERLSRDDADRFVLDGFPRTEKQAIALDDVLAVQGRPLDVVIHLHVPDEVTIERLTARRTCPTCQRTYHLVYDPPKSDERCDDDDSGLVRRPDDDPNTVRHRLSVYHDATDDLLRYYENRDLLIGVDGVGYVEDVSARLDDVVRRCFGESTGGHR